MVFKLKKFVNFTIVKYQYFLGWKYDDDYKMMMMMIPKTIAYVKNYNGEPKWMYFLIEDNELL